MKYIWKIGGEAGFGIMTTGTLFSLIACRSGYYVHEYTEYPSLIRGGHNATVLSFSDTPIDTANYTVDMLICLTKDTYSLNKNNIHENTIIVFDELEKDIILDKGIGLQIPFKEIKKQLQVDQIMINMIALGFSCGLLGCDKKIVEDLIHEQFQKKGEKIISNNISCFLAGYDYVKTNYSQYIKENILKKIENEKKILITGNEAFSIGAVKADCRFFSSYPMTPASTVLSTLALWQNDTKMIVRHAEDEIAAISNTIGASFGGVRCATATSGGGFALMVETISYSGIAEIPIVIFLAQRPGPATGMPTWTEQGDLLFSVFSGHGEFPKIVLAPNDIQDVLDLTMKAFNLADKYQLPVIILSDKILSESHIGFDYSSAFEKIENYYIDKGKRIDKAENDYKRYALTDDGISPLLTPSNNGLFYQANSYEHSTDGHSSEKIEDRISQSKKRAKKIDTYFENDFSLPKIYGDLESAKAILISWGGMKSYVEKARELISSNEIAHISFSHVYPLDKKILLNLFSYQAKYICIENNASGQFAKLLGSEIGVDIKYTIGKNDGRPFYPEEIKKELSKLL